MVHFDLSVTLVTSLRERNKKKKKKKRDGITKEDGKGRDKGRTEAKSKKMNYAADRIAFSGKSQ